uniref:ATPase H+ transporting accessory protein 1a n=1 Tax=Erpetoichthys calabaricus TaxID=27687 RepID=A0A8C4T7X7_ERPCA
MAKMELRCHLGMGLFSLLFGLFGLSCCTDQVPVLIWSTESSLWQSQDTPSVGHVVSGSQLLSYLSCAFNNGPHSVLLFLQDKLSLDDFTVYGGAFGNQQDNAFPNLENALESAPSTLVLPSVDWQASSALPALLQEKLATSPLYIEPSTLSQLRLNETIASLLVLRLPYSTSTHLMSARDVLHGNDDVIGQVLNIMKSQTVPYTAIFTAPRPSRVIREVSLAFENIGRSLLQAPVKPTPAPYPPVMFNRTSSEPCILLWAKGLNLTYSENTPSEARLDLTSRTFGSGASVSLDGSSCSQSLATLVLNYGNIANFSGFRLTFVMSSSYSEVSAREWFKLQYVEIGYNGTVATFNGSNQIYAPRNYSFHCESITSKWNPLLVPFNSTNPAIQWTFSFSEFQIQGFNVTGVNFSYASDCATFFTPGIWMGLVTTLLMTLILTYGLHMIMHLKTMDRFDDPKGPSISVPQNE